MSKEEPQVKVTTRLVSLDAFRGLTILGMLLVNNAALDRFTPRQLTHAAWNQGLTVADLVFPWFLFIVGVAIPFSYASHRAKKLPIRRYAVRAFSRAFWLLALGFLLDSTVAGSPVIGLGVLQLIGLAYLVGALLNPLKVWFRLAVAAVLLVGYWALIRFVAIPGVGAGFFAENNNIIRYLNHNYLGAHHLKGLLSVIPASALTLIGSGVGDLFRGRAVSPWRKTAYLAAGGVALAVIGYLWNLDLPFNKPVWTPSYILFTAGLAGLALSAMYALIDVVGWKKWAFPLVVFGSNAILAYVTPILIKVYILQGWSITNGGDTVSVEQFLLGAARSLAGTINGGWLYTAAYIGVWWAVLLYFHRKGIFLRV